MANWCNARLILTSRRSGVLRFSRLSRARPSSLFESDMLHGERDDLHSERVETLERGLAKTVYSFQIYNDDGREHFCRVSRQFPALCFVLVYFDPNNDPSGSFFILSGRARSYEQPVQVDKAVMAKHGVTEDSEADDCHWDASWELMDLAEAHWTQTLHRTTRA